jgi:D-glycero-D-manno-heptose 1,7-bisphosphate phosphatase
MRPAVFLDRDGTMIHDVGYLSRYDDVRWYGSTVDAIRMMNRAGFLVLVTTNQSGIGRGMYTEEALQSIHERMARHLEAGGATVDAWFYCPHHPQAEVDAYRSVCACRKPAPGMIRQAAARFELDLPASFVIGDTPADLGAASAAGARGVLVRTGDGERTIRVHPETAAVASHVAADLMAATSWLLLQRARPGTAS